MYNNPYMNQFNSQVSIDRINNQISELEKMKVQMQQPTTQPTNLTQNFQLAPTNNHTMRYANTIDDVIKENTYYETPFFSKDMSVLWIKSPKGDIKTYELTEIIPKDEKDLVIESLQEQIEELKGMIKNDANVTNVDAEQNKTNTTGNDSTIREELKSEKSTSFQKIPTSKKK